MVQQVEIVEPTDPRAIGCMLFFLPLAAACGFGGYLLVEQGLHLALAIVGCVGLFAAIIWLCRRFPPLTLVYGVVLTLVLTAGTFIEVLLVSDGIWASLAAVLVGGFCGVLTYGVHKMIVEDDL